MRRIDARRWKVSANVSPVPGRNPYLSRRFGSDRYAHPTVEGLTNRALNGRTEWTADGAAHLVFCPKPQRLGALFPTRRGPSGLKNAPLVAAAPGVGCSR